MKILISADFFSNWEIIRVDTINQAEDYIRAGINGEPLLPEVEILASSEFNIRPNMKPDKVLFVSDYID